MLSHFVSDMRDICKIFVMSIECSNLDLRVWILKFFQGQGQAKRSSRRLCDLQGCPRREQKSKLHAVSTAVLISAPWTSEDSSELKPPKSDSVSPATVSLQWDNSTSEFPALGRPGTPWILWALLPGYSAVSSAGPFPRSANRSPIWETDSGFLGWFPSQSLSFPIHLKWVHLAGSVFGSFWK